MTCQRLHSQLLEDSRIGEKFEWGGGREKHLDIMLQYYNNAISSYCFPRYKMISCLLFDFVLIHL